MSSSIKQLAGQTIWYGLSSIAARFLGYLQTPILTYLLVSSQGQAQYGEVSLLYAVIPFANVVFTYGMETAYFRFSNKDTDNVRLFETSFSSLLLSTLLLGLLLILFRGPAAAFLDFPAHPEYISICVGVIGLDALSAIPFARLRQENRPRKYAFTKVAGIAVNLLLIVFFVGVCPRIAARNPGGAFAKWYGGWTNTGLILLANLIQNIVTFLLLAREWGRFRFRFDAKLWKALLAYAAPFIIIGLGGMINETLDRVMLQKLYRGTPEAAKIATGIYSANYKLAIFITLFLQAFRMAAEPFFFKQAADKNAPSTYAKVMQWFVITLCLAFLTTALFIDVWKRMEGRDYRTPEGLGVVPILLYANIFLGIYYNLAVWYKITDKLRYGIGITLFGALLTLAVNWFFIPRFGMHACAWATFACYGSMMVLSYFFGQRHYRIPYNTAKLLGYFAAITALFFAQRGVMLLTESFGLRLLSGCGLMLAFLGIIVFAERRELKSFPVIGKWL